VCGEPGEKLKRFAVANLQYLGQFCIFEVCKGLPRMLVIKGRGCSDISPPCAVFVNKPMPKHVDSQQCRLQRGQFALVHISSLPFPALFDSYPGVDASKGQQEAKED
jgi:hypothetical protein